MDVRTCCLGKEIWKTLIKLSVFFPGIRPHLWMNVYNSIKRSFSDSFELVIVGPYEPTQEFLAQPNTKFIKDFGSPVRCEQIALLTTRGEYVLMVSDDVIFHPGTLDRCFQTMGRDFKDVCLTKYTEKDPNSAVLQQDGYWKFGFHDGMREATLINPNWYFAASVIIKRDFIVSMGGYDASLFELSAISANDLGVRMQKNGAVVKPADVMVFHVEQGHADHQPIVDTQNSHDLPMFNKLYSSSASVNRIFIDIDNWRSSPSVWGRREFHRD